MTVRGSPGGAQIARDAPDDVVVINHDAFPHPANPRGERPLVCDEAIVQTATPSPKAVKMRKLHEIHGVEIAHGQGAPARRDLPRRLQEPPRDTTR